MSPARAKGRDPGGARPSWSFVWLESARLATRVWILIWNVFLFFNPAILQDIDKYSSFMVLPRDLSQQIFNKLVESNCLTEASLQTFRDCALQVMFLF